RLRAAAGVRVHPLSEGRQGHQGTLRDPALVRFRTVVAGALAALEARREEVNDLNVFPVADGDTGDNMVLTLRAVLDELDRLAAEAGQIDKEIGRDEIVDSVARAALLGARGNSGVILSQLIRGAAEELASRRGELVDPVLIGAAMARAADRAYASVRDPAEGTILTVVREMAHRVASELAHTPAPRLSPDAPPEVQDTAIAAILEPAVTAGEASVKRTPELLSVLRDADVADMRDQVSGRAERLAEPHARCGALAVAAGEGMRGLFESLGVRVLDGGPTLNPSTHELLAGIHAVPAEEVVVLPNSPNVIMAAERAAELSDKVVRVVPTR